MSVKPIIVLLAAFGLGQALHAAEPDDYRGGWETFDNAKAPHILELSIRNAQVRGIYCTRCDDAGTLAFIDGTLGADGLAFEITHVREDGSTEYKERATGKFEDGQLLVKGSREGGQRAFSWTLRKDPRGPAPIPGMIVSKLPKDPNAPSTPVGTPVPRRPAKPYEPPGPWESLDDAKLVGVWLGFGDGIDKQFFIIRKVGSGYRGMVCGRCDNPYTMGALDDLTVRGDTLTFNILHEDWGPGALPNHNQVTAHVSKNEMRISTQPDNVAKDAEQPGFKVEASLMGPVAIRATAR